MWDDDFDDVVDENGNTVSPLDDDYNYYRTIQMSPLDDDYIKDSNS